MAQPICARQPKLTWASLRLDTRHSLGILTVGVESITRCLHHDGAVIRLGPTLVNLRRLVHLRPSNYGHFVQHSCSLHCTHCATSQRSLASFCGETSHGNRPPILVRRVEAWERAFFRSQAVPPLRIELEQYTWGSKVSHSH